MNWFLSVTTSLNRHTWPLSLPYLAIVHELTPSEHFQFATDMRTSWGRWFVGVQGSVPSTGWLGSERSPLYPNKVLAVEKMQSVAYLPL